MSKQKDEDEYALYGGTPPHSDEETSREAAEEARKHAAKKRARVRAFIEQCGERGATDDEIETALGYPHQTASARRRELVLLGLVRDSGRRRSTRNGRQAHVWVPGPWPVSFAGEVPPSQGRVVSSVPNAVELRHAVEAMRVMYAETKRRGKARIPNESDLVRVCLWLQQIARVSS